MFALGIRYLNGWAMASADGAKKEIAEWPPHPDRVFMALSAAWFETEKDESEGAALRWLEQLSEPEIYASVATERTIANRFVPVNDSANPIMTKYKNGIKLEKPYMEMGAFPIGRNRQGRGFPVAVPECDSVFLIWPNTDTSEHALPLVGLCHKVVNIGHSASFVQMWVEKNPPAPNLVPVRGMARHRLRVFGPGRLDYLERRCNRDAVVAYTDLSEKIKASKGKEKKNLQEQLKERFNEEMPVSLRPEPGLWQGYDAPQPAVTNDAAGSVFDPRLVILRLTDSSLSLLGTLKLTEALRNTVMARCPIQPPPEWISGHTKEGRPSEDPHMAVIPMPFVGSAHSDGRLMGASLVIPRTIAPMEVGECLNAILRDDIGLPQTLRLFDGRWLECDVEIDTRENPPFNMRSDTWTRTSRVWASVTPVVFDRHFDGPNKWDKAAVIVKDACERIGLPRPTEVLLQSVSSAEGTPHAREFPFLLRKKDGGRMHHTHAVLIFDRLVEGPILIGAGRYRGYGLFRPMLISEAGNE